MTKLLKTSTLVTLGDGNENYQQFLKRINI